jgi:hypothetical protein
LTFGWNWHTPIVQSRGEPQFLFPANIRRKDKVRLSLLFKGFQAVIMETGLSKFKNKIGYFHLISKDPVDKSHNYTINNIIALALIGDENDLPNKIAMQLSEDL